MSVTGFLFGKSWRKKREYFLPYIQGKVVLDIGCAGEGDKPWETDNWFHKYIAEAAGYCVGIDHNERKVNAIREMGYNVVAVKAQGIELDRQFEVVCAFDVLEHIEDPKSFFLNVQKLLKDDGRLLLSFPNPFFFMRTLRAVFKGDGNIANDHVVWYCNGTIKSMLDRYGFKIEKITHGSGEPRLYKFIFLPKIIRHTSVYVVVNKDQEKLRSSAT
ncbi:MAG: class I SAM-dependent methyltransferase [Bacteroidales bacterium]